VNVIERALSPSTSERYQTAGAFGNALAAAVGVSESRRGEEPARPRFNWWKSAAAIAAVGVLAALWASGVGSKRPAVQEAANSAPVSVPVAPPPGDLTIASADYEVEAAFYALRDTQRVRLADGSAVRPGDRLFLDLSVSRAAYIYLVNRDENGEMIVLFPLPEQEQTNPVPVGPHQLPGARKGVDNFWQVSTVGGREHFLLYVSPTRLVELESLLAGLPRAEPGRPVQYVPLPRSAIGVLRSVGGLTAAPPPASAGGTPLDGLTPLPQTREKASGTWARQISFANPKQERR
jgi:hypothetical protein